MRAPFRITAALGVALLLLVPFAALPASAAGPGSITGTVVDETGAPLQGITVSAMSKTAIDDFFVFALVSRTTTGADGGYVLAGVPEFGVVVQFEGSSGGTDFASMDWPGTHPQLGDVIDVDGVTTGIDAEMVEAGEILVTAYAPTIEPDDFTGYVYASLHVFDFASGDWHDSSGDLFGGPDDEIEFGRLLPGFYYADVTYDGPLGFDSVTSPLLAVMPGEVHTFEAVITPADPLDCRVVADLPTACRIGGQSRFNVSATISEVGFDAGVPVVYIANGLNYPDALSAGPAAAKQDGPLLLVTPDEIPDMILDEIERLQPDKIVVVGGPASVSPSVFAQLTDLAPEIERIGGLGRYHVSRAVARYAFGDSGSTDAYIATGANFPDALSAGGAAASRDAPVITVDGSLTDLDEETRDLLVELGVTTVRIAGGPGSVSPALMESIDDVPGISVVRLWGQGRYEASGAINRDAFASADTIFLSVGTNYPDALSGGALAGELGSPIYVIPSECIPSFVLEDIATMQPEAVVVLGGPGSVHDAVLDYHPCSW